MHPGSRIAVALASLRDIVIIGDNDLVITNMNRPACNFLGWTEDEIRGKSITFLIPGHALDIYEGATTLSARHKNATEMSVVVQTMRDPQATMVVWTLLPVILPPLFDFSFHPTLHNALSPKLTMDDLDFKNRKVFLRVDYNVPIDKVSGKVLDDARIAATLPTIKKIQKDGGRVIIGSHLGRPKKPEPAKSLKPIVARLEELLGTPVTFAPNSMEALPQVSRMRAGDVLLLENLRFYKGEDSKDIHERHAMAKTLSTYADIFVSDAFGTAHRDTASMTGIPRIMGAGVAGYLMDREVRFLSRIMRNPPQPLLAIVGGSKVSDKIALLGNLFNIAQTVIIAGAMAFTFLEAEGRTVGSSKVERVAKGRGREIDLHQVAKDLTTKARANGVRIILPVDHACATAFTDVEPVFTTTADVPEGHMGLDMGPKTIELCVKAIAEARTVVWNGPVGVFELSNFARGSTALGEAIANHKDLLSVVGGGETAAATLKFKSKITHTSTGGGATLELLEGKPLPGLVVLTTKTAAKM